MSQNHVIDPTFFNDAINEFAFEYDAYIVKDKIIDDYGRIVSKFEKQKVVGSLQSSGKRLNQTKTGNTESWSYNFYCKSMYRLDIGDFIYYNDKWLHVIAINDYDEWGVRSCTLNMVQLSSYKDLQEFVKYQQGDIII